MLAPKPGFWQNPAMALRIQDNVVRGEIDNRVKGIVRGRIWLKGGDEPVVLELKGNAHPDLAGCLLTFTNPGPATPLSYSERLDPLQRGGIGDLTASRKVRVPAVPLEEFLIGRRRRASHPPAGPIAFIWNGLAMPVAAW